MIRLDGKACAKARQGVLKARGLAFAKRTGRPACLAVILVGDDPASQVYVGAKIRACQEIGLESREIRLKKESTMDQIREVILNLNQDPSIHGILLQLPLPESQNTHILLEQIDPRKDVDGLHSANMGRLFQGRPRIAPCTPAGVIELLRHYQIPMEGQHAVVIGRSEIVGKPMAQLLLQENATVTLCHSKTRDLKEWTRSADLLVVAAGRPEFLVAQDLKKGAVLVDVGIHRQTNGRLCGDVRAEGLEEHLSAATPVPGGVGPMTISLLLQNTLDLAELQEKEKA